MARWQRHKRSNKMHFLAERFNRPMNAIQLYSATHIPLPDFTHALNAAYADYYVPLDMTVQQLRSRIQQDAIQLEHSVVALQDGEPVAVGMMARRGVQAWIGGVGVLPSHRRQGIGLRLMQALLANARQIGVQEVMLECITQNAAAYALYNQLGFETLRRLHVAEGRPTLEGAPAGYAVHMLAFDEVLPYYDSFHSKPNPWQRSQPALSFIAPYLSCYVALNSAGAVRAYVMGIFLQDAIRLVDLAHAPGDPAALRAILHMLHTRTPDALGSIINIAEDDPAWAVLFLLGYKPFLSQYEMRLRLT